jgi:hypothetical protein
MTNTAHPYITPEDLIAVGEAAKVLGQVREYVDELGRKGVLTRYPTPLGYLYSRRELEARRADREARQEASRARMRARRARNRARREAAARGEAVTTP